MNDEFVAEVLGNRHSFVTQTLPSRRLVLTPRLYIAVFTPLGLAFLVIGSVLLLSTDECKQITVEYGSKCQLGTYCSIPVTIPSGFWHPIAFEYRIDGLYVNHWKSMQSRNDKQLMGQYVRYDDLYGCKPYRSVNDDPSPSEWILPSGLHAVIYFNDTFDVIEYPPLEGPDFLPTGVKVKSLNTLYMTGHKWLDDILNGPNSHTRQRFSIWMDTPAFSSFRRMYARTSDTGKVKPGNITLSIMNNFDVEPFGGKKYIIISGKGVAPKLSLGLGIMLNVSGAILEFAVALALILKPNVAV